MQIECFFWIIHKNFNRCCWCSCWASSCWTDVSFSSYQILTTSSDRSLILLHIMYVVALSCTVCTVILLIVRRVNMRYPKSSIPNAALSSRTVQVSATRWCQKTVKTPRNVFCYVSLSLYYLSVADVQVTLLGWPSGWTVNSIISILVIPCHSSYFEL